MHASADALLAYDVLPALTVAKAQKRTFVTA